MTNELDLDLIFELRKNENNKSEVARKYCEIYDLEYGPTISRRISKIIFDAENSTETNQYSDDYKKLSAIKDNGAIMTIEEYCDFYGLDKNMVKSYKLVTHTNNAYYNIASKNVSEELDLSKFKEDLIKSIEEISNRPKGIIRNNNNKNDKHLLVIDPADIHIGKLSSKYEVGEYDEYNAEIAIRRVHEGVDGILSQVSGFNIDKIMLIVGNDILHTDTTRRTTTGGTPQDTDGMWYENFFKAKTLYIEVIEKLLTYADVHMVYNPSNHDYMTGFLLADIIKTYFKDCSNITFDTSISHRKYFKYGNNLIGSTHGDCGKQADLPLAMAHESSDWSPTIHKYIYTHHVHHKSSKDYMGVCVESLRSASGADSWHHKNLYQHAPKAIEAFLHHIEKGQVGRITYIF